MTSPSTPGRLVALYVSALMLALLSAFFVFYTARLMYVTHWLTALRAGGQGAYVGALVFPVLSLLFGWAAWRCVKASRRA